MKKLFTGAGAAVFSLLILFVLLITSVEAVCYWTPGIYRKEFAKYECPRLLRHYRGEVMDLDGLDQVMDQTMAFLRGNRDDLTVIVPIDGREQEFYNDEEISHMTDVRNLFLLCIRLRRAAFLLALAIALAFWKGFGRGTAGILGRGFFWTSLAVFALAVGTSLLISTDFDQYFTIFHEIFFSQGNWMFDPGTSRMIDIMPEEFFMDLALRIAVTFLAASAALLLLARFLGRSADMKKMPVEDSSAGDHPRQLP